MITGLPLQGAVNDGLIFYLDAGIKGSYPGSGTIWTDLAVSNDGTLTNGAAFNNANGGSIVFDGTNDYVSISASAALRFSNSQAYTIESWVNPNIPIGSGRSIYSYGGDVEGQPAYYFILDNGVLRSGSCLFDYYDGVKAWGVQMPVSSWSNNNWYQFVGTASGNNSSSGAFLYINGNSVTATSRNNSFPASISAALVGYPCQVGARNSSLFFSENISIVRVYNRALTSLEVKQNFEVTRNRFGI